MIILAFTATITGECKPAFLCRYRSSLITWNLKLCSIFYWSWYSHMYRFAQGPSLMLSYHNKWTISQLLDPAAGSFTLNNQTAWICSELHVMPSQSNQCVNKGAFFCQIAWLGGKYHVLFWGVWCFKPENLEYVVGILKIKEAHRLVA